LILNLVDNALKYSEKDPIVLGLAKSGNVLFFSVSNQGMSLATQDKQRVFEKFYRVGDEDTRRKPGTGLGLFIVKYIVEKHGGSIDVKDNIPSGCVFEVAFKLVKQ
jgi:signal transduction histidine kinase